MTNTIQIIVLGVLLGGVYALMASGLTMIYGVMQIINLAHGAFMVLAAYLAFFLFRDSGVDPFVSILITAPAFFVLGVIIYTLLFRRLVDSPRFGEITVLLSFGLALTFEGSLGQAFSGIYHRSDVSYSTSTWDIGSIFIPKGQAYGFIACLAIFGLLWAFLYLTRPGYAIRATMQNRGAAQVVGVNVTRISTIAFGHELPIHVPPRGALAVDRAAPVTDRGRWARQSRGRLRGRHRPRGAGRVRHGLVRPDVVVHDLLPGALRRAARPAPGPVWQGGHGLMADELAESRGVAQRQPSAERPARIKRIDSKKGLLALALLALLCVPLTYPVLTTYSYTLQIMTTGFLWIALASSWNIIGGYAGYISLGHNVFLAAGAYFAGGVFAYMGVSPFLMAPVAGLVCVLLGTLVGVITLRTRGPAFIISTIALMLIARILFDNWDYLGGSNGLSLPLLDLETGLIKVPFYYGMLLCAIGAVYLSYRVRHSKFGLGLRAIAEDEVKAEVAGIDTRAYKIAAFALSGFFIGAAGALWGYSLFYLRPEAFLTLAVAADIVLMAIIGGRATVAGPVIGAVIIVAFNEISVSQLGSNELNLAITGVLLIGALLFFPLGVVGTLRERRKLPRILDWD